MKDLDNPTVGPVHLQLFRPSVIRGPWLTIAAVLLCSQGGGVENNNS